MQRDRPPLALLDDFVARALPTVIRRLRSWKGLNTKRHADVLQDLRQDLLVDCLENAETITAMSRVERHARWFRLLERRHYQLRVRESRRAEPTWPPDDLAIPASSPIALADMVSEGDQRMVRRLQLDATTLKNGRLNAEATAGQLGVHPRDVRAFWGRVADALGYDDQFLAFWRRRLVEALVGLGADLLRDRGLVRVHNESARARPDPRGRLRRIAQIKRQVNVRPLPSDLKSVLAQFTRRGVHQRVDAWMALQAAACLSPRCSAVHLWQFENAVAHGLLREAARALRRARATGGDPIRLTLARARLLEASGRTGKAEMVLRRSATRHRGDVRLTAALPELSAAG